MSIGACRVISNPAACLKPSSCTYLWSASPYFPGGCPPWQCCHGHRSSLSVTRCVALLACLVKELESSPCHILFRRSPLIVNLLRKDCRNSCLILSSRCCRALLDPPAGNLHRQEQSWAYRKYCVKVVNELGVQSVALIFRGQRYGNFFDKCNTLIKYF